MFSNFDEHYLWRIASKALKNRDSVITTKIEYLGEDRGQTERFYIVLGKLIKSCFSDIEMLGTGKDSTLSSELKAAGLYEPVVPISTPAKNKLLSLSSEIIKGRGGIVAFDILVRNYVGFSAAYTQGATDPTLIKTLDINEPDYADRTILQKDEVRDTTGTGLIYKNWGQPITVYFRNTDADVDVKKAWVSSIIQDWFSRPTLIFTDIA